MNGMDSIGEFVHRPLRHEERLGSLGEERQAREPQSWFEGWNGLHTNPGICPKIGNPVRDGLLGGPCAMQATLQS